MLIMFVTGVLATTAGALAAMWLLNGKAHTGEWYYVIVGLYTGTYTGGVCTSMPQRSITAYRSRGVCFLPPSYPTTSSPCSGGIVTLALPEILHKRFPGPATPERLAAEEEDHHAHLSDKAQVAPFDLAFLLLVSMAGVKISGGFTACSLSSPPSSGSQPLPWCWRRSPQYIA